MSENETRAIGFHGIEPDPDEPIYLPSGHTMQTPEERQRHVEQLREEAAREKERFEALREQRLREEAAEHEKWMEENAPSEKAIAAVLVDLLAEHGIDLRKIDLDKIAQVNRDKQRLAALADELKELAALAKTDNTSPSTVTALDADIAARMMSCVDEINQLTARTAAYTPERARDQR